MVATDLMAAGAVATSPPSSSVHVCVHVCVCTCVFHIVHTHIPVCVCSHVCIFI